MKLHLEIWRQSGPRDGGRFVSYEMDEAVPDMSFLELLDVLNERLERAGEEPVAFEHDCPRGDLRKLRLPDQRPRPRSCCVG